jgi:hypothetical protein
MHKRTLTLLTLSAIVPFAQAGGVADYTRIVGIDTRTSGDFLVTVQTAATGQPACATDHTRFSGSATTDGGKAMLENAIAAFHAGTTIHIEGRGTCDQFGTIESLYRVAQTIP